MIVTRTKQIWIKPNKTLSWLCHLSKNLYNEGNYQIRQKKFKNCSIYIFNEYIKMKTGQVTLDKLKKYVESQGQK